jgi:hypothetical protein
MLKFSNIILPSNKKFGFFFSFVFFISALYFFFLNSSHIGYIFLIFSISFVVITLFNASLLQPLNKLWMGFGLILGNIISPIVLLIIFFGIFTPYSIIMKMVGRDELRLKKNKNNSHWIVRSQTLPQTNFKKQF